MGGERESNIPDVYRNMFMSAQLYAVFMTEPDKLQLTFSVL